jgi:starch phosphorylase
MHSFDPDALTIGFARRLATYKRLDLLLHEPERALALVNSDRPIQIVIAGKAHPKDDGGKQLIQRLMALRGAPGVGHRIVFLHDYDLELGARLVQGCDVWLNVPRPPLEASGTSGMKSAINGGLQLSVLDGWWPEASDEAGGWSLSGEVDPDHAAHRARLRQRGAAAVGRHPRPGPARRARRRRHDRRRGHAGHARSGARDAHRRAALSGYICSA